MAVGKYYDSVTKEYPKTAAFMQKAGIIAGPTVAGLLAPAPGSAAIGFGVGVGSLLKSEIIDLAAGDQIAAGLEKLRDVGSDFLMNEFDLSKPEASSLVGAGLFMGGSALGLRDNIKFASSLKMKLREQHNARQTEGSSVLFKKSFDDTGIGLKSKDYGALHNSKVDVSSKPVIKDYSDQSGEVISLDRNVMKSKGWVDAYKESFPNEVNWTAPNGTKQTYKVHQRDDINWDHVRTGGDYRFIGKTNREAALSGMRPQLDDGSFVTIHHIGQNALGPLVETTTNIHSFKNQNRFKALHNQFPGKKHPEFPVDHGSKWQSDVKEYWKWRVQNNE